MEADFVAEKHSGPGDFHGAGGGYATLRIFITAICAIAVLLYPWMNLLLAHHHPGARARILANALSVTAILGTAVITYIRLYRKLARLIAKGGGTAIELDRIRTDLSSFALGAGLVAMLVWWSGVLSARL